MNTLLVNNGLNSLPTIICVAESTHYLIGCVDAYNDFIGLNEYEDVVALNSLVEAKGYLRDRNIFSATLEFQTAYDEMCGSSSNSDRCSQMINF